MTRPQIIRADTLDLQDRSSPTAQDHTAQPAHPAPLGVGPPAPHQQAALHHLQEERASEEEHFSQAWHDSAGADGDSDDGAYEQHQAAVNGRAHQGDGQANGNHGGQGDDQEMGEGESDNDMDDDMMDKISSSPSIDDGGSREQFLPASIAARGDSLTTPQRDHRRGHSTPPSGLVAGSFSRVDVTPERSPLSLISATPGSGEKTNSAASSPYAASPAHLPLFSLLHSTAPTSEVHHHHGEYTGHGHDLDNTDDADDGTDEHEEGRDEITPLPSTWRRDHAGQLERDTSVSSLGEEAMKGLLLPTDDPMLDQLAEADSPTDSDTPMSNTPGSTDEDDEGWETESEASSWDSDEYREKRQDDDTKDISLTANAESAYDPRFVDFGWGGECLRELEDIDFEFVYALHTFVATVEGQANATKGDTMVLLDDSNSYWWLVRIVKDSSIGYLPAEHIETPTERLARYHKHRNIDLSATMLGDTLEKSKNPLKKAMRRRNGRTVQFNAQPQYFEPSDYEYSSDEEGDEDRIFADGDGAVQEPQASAQQNNRGGIENTPNASSSGVVNGHRDPYDDDDDDVELNGRADEVDSRSRGPDQPRPSEESLLDKQFGPGRSRNGTVRNTDSFYRDETVETRKITLTPNILRDDSSAATTLRTSDSRERASFDSIDKSLKSESPKEDRKRKEKKSGMFSGLFKKKDKKAAGKEGDDALLDEKQSGQLSPKLSGEDSSPMMSPTFGGPQRAGSRGKPQKGGVSRQDTLSPEHQRQDSDVTAPSGYGQPNSMRVIQSEEDSLRTKPAGEARGLADDTQPSKVRQAKQRVALDDFDSSPDETDQRTDPFGDTNELHAGSRQQPAAKQGPAAERLSESPVHVSPVGATHSLDTEASSPPPPALVGDDSESQDDAGPSPASSPEFEDVAEDYRAQQQQAARAAGRHAFNHGHTAAPAPLQITKHTGSPNEPNHYVPPPPTRTAPTPGSGAAGRERTASPSVARNLSGGARSVTPTSRQGSNLNPKHAQGYAPRAPSPASTATSATPTAASYAPTTTPATPAPNGAPSSAPTTPKPEPRWSDASLRAYMDDPSHVRNLLLLVNDTSGLVPLRPGDSRLQAWYPEERAQLKSLERGLDKALEGWIERKRSGRANGVKA